jgi:hypothetical protein
LSDNDDISDTDDGLGYTLPNLPVYRGDDEGESTYPGTLTTPPLSLQRQCKHSTHR